jgi:hypothetical protein
LIASFTTLAISSGPYISSKIDQSAPGSNPIPRACLHKTAPSDDTQWSATRGVKPASAPHFSACSAHQSSSRAAFWIIMPAFYPAPQSSATPERGNRQILTIPNVQQTPGHGNQRENSPRPFFLLRY